MEIWQADFYRRPLTNQQGQILWELLICYPNEHLYEAYCPQPQVNAAWLTLQIQKAANGKLPEVIQVFRPQSLSLLEAAGNPLGITIEATRRTSALKAELQKRAPRYSQMGYNPIKLEQPPPQALPENLWGENWRFGTLVAGDLVEVWRERPIPILVMPEDLLPINLGIASTTPIPGVAIDGGRKSMQLARWLQQEHPVALNYIATEVGRSGGLIVESGLVNRWVMATFEDSEVAVSAEAYEQRKQASRGLHFLLVQPDDSGVTYSGFWLLQPVVL